MPRNITVTFDDGSTHVYQNAPDDVTPEAVSARAQQEFSKAVTSLDGGRPAQKTKAPNPPAAPQEDKSFLSRVGENVGNEVAGLVRGAGSIGATILYPVDAIHDKIAGDRDPTIKDLITGKQPLTRNQERRQSMDAALETMGAQPNSGFYQGGKIAGEIAGTAGAGGVVANTARIPLAAIAGSRAAPILTSIETGGMNAGGLTGIGGAATRLTGGAISGGAMAGMVDPKNVKEGALIGAAIPAGVKALGVTGQKIGEIVRGGEQSPELASAIKNAQNSGLVIPPTQANPTALNKLVEGMAGKISTAQNASAKNQSKFNELAAKSLGLDADTKITPEVLQGIRAEAGKAYEAASNSGAITPTKEYFSKLDDIAAPYLKAAQGFPNAKPSPVIDLVESLKSPQFDSSAAVAKIKELRSAADDAFRTGNTDVARASKSAATALEDALETHLVSTGNTEALNALKDARKLIAKTYSVDKALNPSTGSIDAKKLAAQLKKGKPISGELKTIAEFASSFPKASQAVEGMGSLPQTSPLDWALGGGLAAASSNPLLLAGVLARPAARKYALSEAVQGKLVKKPVKIPAMLANPDYLTRTLPTMSDQ